MNRKLSKTFAVVMSALLCMISSVFICSATQKYTISEIDDMIICLPDNMSAVTRDSKNTDRYFSVFGLDYNTTMQNFKNGDIYLQGMDSFASTTVTVTMTKTDESKGIGNYNLLDDVKLAEVANNFLSQNEYTACTEDTAGNIVWLNFNTDVNYNGKSIKAYQANTVYNGMSVNITLQRNAGDVTAEDYAEFIEIVSSVSFLKTNAITGAEPYIIIGIAIGAIIIIILLVIFIKKAKKRRKKNRNDKILEELAGKYTSKRSNKSTEIDYGDYDIRSAEVEHEDDVKLYGEQTQQNRAVSDGEVDKILEYSRHENKSEQVFVDKNAEADSDVQFDAISENFEGSEEIKEADKINEKSDVVSEISDDFFGEADLTDENDDDNDEELVRQESKQSKFKDSDDFFEEAPKKVMGVISSKDIRDAEDFDVITEVENRVTEVEKAGANAGDVFLNVMKNIGGGIKSFGIHLGYFCTNVSRMIKRKRAINKRKKEEEQRRERARMRAERERTRRQQMQNGELVRVHSKNDIRVPQNRRGTSQRRPSSTQNRGRSGNSKRK